LWAELGSGESITIQPWPDYLDEYTTGKSIEFVIQVNGQVRAKININRGMDEQKVEALVLDNPVVKKWIKDKLIIKKVFIADRLMNFVVK
jgi:leucyl-tRNA synthetase